jgi:pimeloyl-ACP methyl ester carboxylesterase
MITEDVEFKNSKNLKIVGKIYKKEPSSKEGLIFAHGLFSSKNSHKVVQMAPSFVDAGFTFCAFDFSFAGDSDGDFSDLSLLQEVDDLDRAVQFFKSYGLESIHLLGSSVGGVVTILYASKTKEKISSISVIAPPYHLTPFIERIANIDDINKLPDKGMTSISEIFINNSFFKEFKNINLRKSIKKISIPTMIIIGSNDELIPLDSIKEMQNTLKVENKLVVIDDGDHTLARQRDLDTIKENIIQWIKK